MAVPKKRVSKMRGSLRHTNWKKELIPQALIALSMGKKQLQMSSRQGGDNLLSGETKPVSINDQGELPS